MRTRVGYAGGDTPNPTYTEIGDHAEAIEIDFDPAVISFPQILDIIWESHNPTRNFGSSQYRHIIWYKNETQKQELEASVEKKAKELGITRERIVTAIEPAGVFTYAEDYHQKYVLRRQKDIIDPLLALFPDHIAFTDSAVMTRLNGWFGNGESNKAALFRDEIASFGLPEDLEKKVLSMIR